MPASTLNLIIKQKPGQLVRDAADRLQHQLDQRPASVIALPTGRTPLLFYRELVRRQLAGEMDLRQAQLFTLDEYLGLGPDHPASFAAYMHRHLIEPAGLSPRQLHHPLGNAADPEAECRRYESLLEDHGGLDLLVLGLGLNGHIGFNEPGSSFSSRARPVTLSPSTRAANRDQFRPGDPLPEQALTLGIENLLKAREILLLAFGKAKADAVEALVQGPVGPEVPATALRRHPRVRVFLDQGAVVRLGKPGRERPKPETEEG